MLESTFIAYSKRKKPAYVGETERQDKVRKYEHGFHPRSEATKVHSLSAEIKTNNTDLIPDSDEEQQGAQKQQPRRSVRQKTRPKVDYKQMHEGKKNRSLILNMRNQ